MAVISHATAEILFASDARGKAARVIAKVGFKTFDIRLRSVDLEQAVTTGIDDFSPMRSLNCGVSLPAIFSAIHSIFARAPLWI